MIPVVLFSCIFCSFKTKFYKQVMVLITSTTLSTRWSTMAGRCFHVLCIIGSEIQEKLKFVDADQCVLCLCRSTSTRCCMVCASSTLWFKSAASLDLWDGTSHMSSMRPICESACGSCRCSSMSMK